MLQTKQASSSTTDSVGDVPRTDALWNKLACPRESTGSLSEAIYSPHTQTRRWSGVPRVHVVVVQAILDRNSLSQVLRITYAI